MNRLSVVITSYNYARYVGEAVGSALALDWPDVEVVVVDDGSTDGSQAVLDAYRDRARVVETENRGQRSAANTGYAATTGDVVLFLDADDVLPPDLPAALDAAMGPGVSKAQFRMQRIDADGKPVGEPFPRVRSVPTPAAMRSWLLRTTAYPTPPSSGNAYARWFLERVLPLGPEAGDFNDSALLAASPMVGDVRWVEGPLVRYRVHGQNDSELLADPTRFAREIRRARDRWRWALTATGTRAPEDRVYRSREVMQFRAAALRLVPEEEGLAGDGRARVLRHAIASPTWPGPEPLARRLAVAAWTIAVALAPRSAATRLVALRYARS